MHGVGVHLQGKGCWRAATDQAPILQHNIPTREGFERVPHQVHERDIIDADAR